MNTHATLRRAFACVGDIMTANVVSLQPRQSLQDAITLFGERRFRHLLVTEGQVLVGVISDRDVLQFVAQNPNASNAPVTSIMTKNPITISRSASLADAMSAMIKRRIHCLPVVGERGEVEGILTTTDLTRALYAIQNWLERHDPGTSESAETHDLPGRP